MKGQAMRVRNASSALAAGAATGSPAHTSQTLGDLRAADQREARRLLLRLAAGEHVLERREETLVLIKTDSQTSLPLPMGVGALAVLIERGAVVCRSHSGVKRYHLTPEGGALVRRLQADQDPFADQHREIVLCALPARTSPEDAVPDQMRAQTHRVRVNLREDPIAYLCRSAHLAHWLGPAEMEAAARFQQDLHLANLLPSVTINWSRLAVDYAGSNGGLQASEVASHARQRIARASAALGPDLANVLMDVCGFGKGLEGIEAERHLPARSGKVVLVLALRALARHYGLGNAVTGPSNAGSSKAGPKRARK